ncbi:MBL fold metallo-hydrolase [Cytobacillus sp. IB215316]|uniref:MBL fold metallo-hydrolase n=1 Tax=Cytobacillus sp. IB215316 TaxID=3097354 RepID=UPI002A184640|nr:MBL fold metallo-hydrolase [Cytobacillus sp. IB215316]MDX8359698.1 MBL fold metallo-hydrolase [Cytobacillus sp. IB215316]
MEQILKLTVPTPFPVGDVNMYLIKGDSLTLIDAGIKTEEAWNVFRTQLNEYGYRPEDIEQVVITHHHPDHVGLLDYLPADLPVIGHPKNEPWISQDKEYLTQRESFFTSLFFQAGIDPAYMPLIAKMKLSLRFSCTRSLTREIIQGDTIDGLHEWKVIETPGHAQSHIVLYRESDGLLIAGDHLLAAISPNPLLEAPMFGEINRPKPQLQYNESIKKLLDIDISYAFTGHGEDIEDAHSLILKRLDKQKEKAYYVLDMLKKKPMTAFEVCKQLYPSVYQKELALTMSEAFGQLDYLVDINEIVVDTSSEQWLYSAQVSKVL